MHYRIGADASTLHGPILPERAPLLTVQSGDTIEFDLLDAGWHLAAPAHGQEPSRHPARQAGHALIGPVAVQGAEPGMALEVEVLRLEPGSWGWTRAGGFDSPINRALGLVGQEAAELLTWQIDAAAGLASSRGFSLPICPFLGWIGLCPAEPGPHSTTPPRSVGGNLDCRELVAGSKLFLPVARTGALLSVGDGHAAQGDGELSGTAIECPMRAALRLTLHPVPQRPFPRAEVPRAPGAPAYITFGLSEDLNAASVQATAAMLDWICQKYGVTQSVALALASPSVGLRVTQVANLVWGVHATLEPFLGSPAHG